MESESVTYDGANWIRYPESSRRSDRVYFKGIIDGELRYLHRHVWEKHHGPIPEGYHVHHRDGDALNNDIGNLEIVTPKDHIEEHWTEERMEAARQHMDEIRELASAWHRSPEGREWHRIHGKESWEGREPVTLICDQCGEEFETLARHGNTRFCSNSCKSAWRRASGIDDERRTCAYCGAWFMVNKYSKATHCSRLCAARHRVDPERTRLQPGS